MKRLIIAVLAAGVLLMSGCTVKDVDIEKTGAVPVPGAAHLYRFCDGTTLIYFTKVAGDSDQYEAFWLNGCVPDGDKTPRPGAGSDTTGNSSNGGGDN